MWTVLARRWTSSQRAMPFKHESCFKLKFKNKKKSTHPEKMLDLITLGFAKHNAPDRGHSGPRGQRSLGGQLWCHLKMTDPNNILT